LGIDGGAAAAAKDVQMKASRQEEGSMACDRDAELVAIRRVIFIFEKTAQEVQAGLKVRGCKVEGRDVRTSEAGNGLR